MQLNLFASQVSALVPVSLPDADVRYQSDWIAPAEAIQLFERLQQELPWRQDTIKLYGREVNIPRLQSWHGAPHCEYTYSNLCMSPAPMSPILVKLQQRLSSELGAPFNCVLANWYRDGNDGMGMHADDEPELGTKPVIASVSLGYPRRFSFKHLGNGQRTDLLLESGSLLVMAGDTQRHYHHGLSKTRKPTGGRINLTFRYIPASTTPALEGNE
ncbi:alpha-ketoglutarate-dependent dioxygenase AlkB family protein [Alteromonas lipolytica]|uniref:DNA repair protein n=1 Tax=Alteromonas lipolytica TaxID=1856405 RepID=A0A1E8FCN6_9ALTE|nr:alpha-ketoglutarate-dependent dioxygenase AlkB [Alteromonas lipolytica]OFI33697.1 DNA repair protein [Alteromonas lipolytica]GGF69267.1 DNA methylase [Alteromonas lipolytica]